MNTNIGKFDIEIGANGKQAARELDSLFVSVQRFVGLDTSSFQLLNKSIKSLCGANVSNIYKITTALTSLAPSLNNVTIDFSGSQELVQFTATIKQLGSKAVLKAIDNIPELGKAVKLLFNDLSTLPEISENTIKMTNALVSFASQGSKIASSTKKIKKSFEELEKSSKKSSKGISKAWNGFIYNTFASVTGSLITKALSALSSGIKGSLEYASALVETENVTQNTFKSCASVIEQFSKSAITSFGMNELEAKKMAGRYQAMGTAMGESVDRMSSVSVAISKLAGDYASFYNLSVEETAEKFNSIFTGAVKPLRQFGLDLSKVTLEQYAQQKGITKSFKAMTQLEKAQLRYNYIVDHSSAIMGDFARTQDSYANQTKVLSQQLQDLFGSLGTIAINVLTPIIKSLNEVIARLRVVAKYVADVFSKTFGFQQVSGGAVAYDDLTESVEDYGDAVEKANKKQATTGIDELNIINQDTNNEEQILSASDALGDWNDEWSRLQDEMSEQVDNSWIDELASKISPICNEIQHGIVEPLQKGAIEAIQILDINSFKVAGENVGMIFSNALFTAIDVGKFFSEKVASIFPMLSVLANKLVTYWNEYIKNLNVSGLFDAIGTALKFFIEIFIIKVKTAIAFFQGAIDGMRPFIEPIASQLNKIIDSISEIFNTLLGGALASEGPLTNIAYLLGTVVGGALGTVLSIVAGVINVAAGVLSFVIQIAAAIANFVINVVSGLSQGKGAVEAISDAFSIFKETAGKILEGLIEKIKSFIDMLFGIPSKIKEAFAGIGEKASGIFEGIGNWITGKSDTEVGKEIGEEITSNIASGVVENNETIQESISSAVDVPVESISANSKELGSNIANEISNGISEQAPIIKERVKNDLYEEPYNAITGTEGWGGTTKSSQIATDIVTGFTNGLNDQKKLAVDAIISWATELLNSFKGTPELGINYDYFMEQAHQIIQGFAIGVDSNKNLAINAINNLKTDILNTFTNYGEIAGVNAITFDDYARLINEGFAEGINKWGYIAKEAVRIWAEEILAEFEDEMDIESPSKKFYKDGGFVVQGFNNAIKDGMKSSVEEVKNWGANIESAFNKYVNNNAVNIPVGIEAGGIIGNIASQNQNAYENAIRLNREYTQQSQQPINISLKVDSREIARANYKGQKELGYRIKE